MKSAVCVERSPGWSVKMEESQRDLWLSVHKDMVVFFFAYTIRIKTEQLVSNIFYYEY